MSVSPEAPVVSSVEPAFALPGGEMVVHGRALLNSVHESTRVVFGTAIANLVFASPTRLVVQVPDAASGADTMTIATAHGSVNVPVTVATLLGEELHPVANPAVDELSNIYITFSGGRGQSVPTSLYRIDDSSIVHPLVAEVMNPTALALDAAGNLYISSRHDGAVYRLTPSGELGPYAEGMGVATGMAFDASGNLYVGDRSGTIFKIAPSKEIFVFATLEPSVAAYHLAFSPNRNLYVTAPSTSSNDCVYEITPQGMVTRWFEHLGRPQGMAFDDAGNLYVVACWQGRRGIVRIAPQKQATHIIAGPSLVGLAFDAGRSLVLATTSAAYFIPWKVQGFIHRPLLP